MRKGAKQILTSRTITAFEVEVEGALQDPDECIRVLEMFFKLRHSQMKDALKMKKRELGSNRFEKELKAIVELAIEPDHIWELVWRYLTASSEIFR